MIRPTFDDEEEKPLDPGVEKVRKKLVRFVAINLGLLFVALMAVVAAIVYKTRSEAPAVAELPHSDIPVAAGAVLEGEIALPAGARIVSQSLSGSRLSLGLEMPGGSRAIYLYDLAERRIVGRFTITAQ
ncbi:fimbrial protein [Mesorhizobium sp. LHD-90]|uniref:fimbrial protein n=1 Tax=Mesorhizobium sp. LHD-90 TaxID=3071414 RepID=UPI0027DF6CDD|nr:fimbrial protein [Mesorhizobium sp. LHD-90]MDQ6432753.1 fimbrial protein [Mesorhizobium sp. LHD-90]